MPAIVTIRPPGSTARITWFSVSAMITEPSAASAASLGRANLAAVANAPSPHQPNEPVPGRQMLGLGRVNTPPSGQAAGYENVKPIS